MSNPWRESFDDLRYDNGNTYDYFENISEATGYSVDYTKVREAVYQIKQKARRDNVRLAVAMNQYFATAKLGPAERAAVRSKIMGMREDVELDENIQAIQRGYASADRNTAQALGRAQQAQQRIDAMRRNANQKKQKLTTGGAPTQFGEETMTTSDKAKEKRLKSKYDKSGMKQSMIDQYGEKKGKQVYFAKIRKMAMEGLDSFVEEKYGETEEKKYKKSGKKSKDYDGDGTVEDESHEYAGVKDRAIKKAMRKESSDWRADLGFFTEKRYPESPRVETMPPEKQNDSEQAPKERAANKRLKPKSSEVKESIEEAFLDYGAEVISIHEGRVPNLTPALKALTRNVARPVTFAEPVRKTPLSIIMRPAPKTTKVPLSINLGPAPRTKFTASQKPQGVVSAKPRTTPAVSVTQPAPKQKQALSVSMSPAPKPRFTTKQKPQGVVSAKVKPTAKPQPISVSPKEAPNLVMPKPAIPVKLDTRTGTLTTVKPQTQTQAVKKIVGGPGIGIGIPTIPGEVNVPRRGRTPRIEPPSISFGAGNTWVARSL